MRLPFPCCRWRREGTSTVVSKGTNSRPAVPRGWRRLMMVMLWRRITPWSKGKGAEKAATARWGEGCHIASRYQDACEQKKAAAEAQRGTFDVPLFNTFFIYIIPILLYHNFEVKSNFKSSGFWSVMLSAAGASFHHRGSFHPTTRGLAAIFNITQQQKGTLQWGAVRYPFCSVWLCLSQRWLRV